MIRDNNKTRFDGIIRTAAHQSRLAAKTVRLSRENGQTCDAIKPITIRWIQVAIGAFGGPPDAS